MILDKTECLNWCFGNLVENIVRGKVAEFIVFSALGDDDVERSQWEYADLTFGNKLIEVKSSAYIQSWKQKKLPVVRFDIRKRSWGWNLESGDWIELKEPARFADVYVFSLFATRNRTEANPLDTDQWQFYVITRDEVDQRFGNMKSIGLARLEDCSTVVSFGDLRENVLRHLSGPATRRPKLSP